MKLDNDLKKMIISDLKGNDEPFGKPFNLKKIDRFK